VTNNIDDWSNRPTHKDGVRTPRDTMTHTGHPRPMAPAELASDTGGPAHPLPEGARDLRGAEYDARVQRHKEYGHGKSRNVR
jgi:hypothetical protein